MQRVHCRRNVPVDRQSYGNGKGARAERTEPTQCVLQPARDFPPKSRPSAPLTSETLAVFAYQLLHEDGSKCTPKRIVSGKMVMLQSKFTVPSSIKKQDEQPIRSEVQRSWTNVNMYM
ncbi:hypothetical protein NDU88_003904 [Pleurodeles waltl]|uniref:Uncharacterized protein n=1 Tax=Pleurodeles waltl TaxID=8319 RepID=A0AAV7VGP1_PLEWA|nr:hypothetical protein NDU88_003904 [Pleurodeles waltl]